MIVHPAAILWDLDGVLVDSRDAHMAAWRALCAEFGLPCDPAYFARTFGRRNDDIIRGFAPLLSAEAVAAAGRRKEALFRGRARGRIRALPGAAELVREATARGIPQALVSSTPRSNIDLALDEIGLTGAFAAFVAEEDVTRGKPDPEGFLLAAARLGVDHARCVVVEDTPAGVEAARRAGARTVGVAHGQPPHELGANLVVDELTDPRAREALLGE